MHAGTALYGGMAYSSLTGGPVGLMSRAKLVRWKHWHTVVLLVVLKTLQPSVSHDTLEPLENNNCP